MKSSKEQKPPISPDILVLERLIGHVRIMRRGNDAALAEAAAKVEQRLNKDLAELKPAA